MQEGKPVGLILWVPLQQFVNVDIFFNFDLWGSNKSQRIPKVSSVHPLGTMNGCTKFCAKTSSRYWDILTLACGATWKIKGSPKSVDVILWGPWVSMILFIKSVDLLRYFSLGQPVHKTTPRYALQRKTDKDFRLWSHLNYTSGVWPSGMNLSRKVVVLKRQHADFLSLHGVPINFKNVQALGGSD